MDYQVSPLVILSLLNSGVAAVVALLCWPRRHVRSATPLMVMMVGLIFWGIFAALEMAAVPLATKVLWNTFLYVPLMSVPVAYLVFALSYKDMNRYLGHLPLTLMLLVPAVVIMLAATNEWHHLIWTSFSPAPGGHNLVLYGHGKAFWIGTVGYSYLTFVIGSLLLGRAALQFPKHYRPQAFGILIGSLFPFCGSLYFVLGFAPIPGLDVTPLCLAASGVVFGWAILRMQLLDMVPVARAVLLETMPDGLIVFDEQQRLIDYNPAAQRFADNRLVMGMISDDLPRSWNPLCKQLHLDVASHVEFSKPTSHNPIYLDARISPMAALGKPNRGHMVLVRDVTIHKKAESALRFANERLQEMATRDVLTGLFNRRYLMDTLKREFARARRENLPISVAMLDIDFFKVFNDKHGHQAGDAMLQSLGAILRQRTRQEDIACRYGGEEFAIILPGASTWIARQRAEIIRREFANFSLLWGSHRLSSTLSIGIATYPDHGETDEDILREADKALYRAKGEGRNRICASKDSFEAVQFELEYLTQVAEIEP